MRQKIEMNKYFENKIVHISEICTGTSVNIKRTRRKILLLNSLKKCEKLENLLNVYSTLGKSIKFVIKFLICIEKN